MASAKCNYFLKNYWGVNNQSEPRMPPTLPEGERDWKKEGGDVFFGLIQPTSRLFSYRAKMGLLSPKLMGRKYGVVVVAKEKPRRDDERGRQVELTPAFAALWNGIHLLGGYHLDNDIHDLKDNSLLLSGYSAIYFWELPSMWESVAIVPNPNPNADNKVVLKATVCRHIVEGARLIGGLETDAVYEPVYSRLTYEPILHCKDCAKDCRDGKLTIGDKRNIEDTLYGGTKVTRPRYREEYIRLNLPDNISASLDIPNNPDEILAAGFRDYAIDVTNIGISKINVISRSKILKDAPGSAAAIIKGWFGISGIAEEIEKGDNNAAAKKGVVVVMGLLGDLFIKVGYLGAFVVGALIYTANRIAQYSIDRNNYLDCVSPNDVWKG